MKPATDGTLGVAAAGLGEPLRLGRDLGLDPTLLLDLLGQTAYGWFLGQKRPMRASLDQVRRTVEAGHGGEDYASITGHMATSS